MSTVTQPSHKQEKPLLVVGNHFLSGLVVWALCIQYYLVQIAVALDWKTPKYSLARNTISDLGNTVCGPYGTRVVCSQLHPVMNISFVVLGVLMAAGALLLYSGMRKSAISLIGFFSIAIAGLGTIMVGLFPENTISGMHITGAALSFVVGNIGLLCFGFLTYIPRSLRICALLFGMVALFALVLFMTHQYLGIGIGGMERIVAYPQTVWLIIFAIYMLRVRYLPVRHAFPGAH